MMASRKVANLSGDSTKNRSPAAAATPVAMSKTSLCKAKESGQCA